jgi:hypothetical protein
MTGAVDIIPRDARRDRIGGDALIVLGRCKLRETMASLTAGHSCEKSINA